MLGKAWEENLDEIVADGKGVDLVCVTGDVAFDGKPDQYDEAEELLQATLDRLGLDISRLFMVPGNHDINRNLKKREWKELRDSLSKKTAKRIGDWLAGGKTPTGLAADHRRKILERQTAFRLWIDKKLGRTELLPKCSRHGRLGYQCRVELPGISQPIYVIGLDSAWLCGDDSDKGSAWLTETQVKAHVTGEEGQTLDGYRLALVHHPLEALADGNQSRQLLAEHIDLLLHGHEHDSDALRWQVSAEGLCESAAGCLYEHDSFPCSFQVIDVLLDEAGRPAGYHVRFRTWSAQGTWCDDERFQQNMPEAADAPVESAEPVPADDAPEPIPTDDAPEPVPMDDAPEPMPAEPRVFVGRQGELAELEEALLSTEGEIRPVAIGTADGIHGVGKSYLAQQFCDLHADKYPGGILRLALDSRAERTAQSLATELCDQLKMPAAPAEIFTRLAERLRNPRTLVLILDVDQAESAQTVANLARRLAGCALLVTGRHRDLGNSEEGWTRLALSPLGAEEGLEQLRRELGVDANRFDTNSLRRFVETLGGVPLAIHLAAGLLRGGGTVEGFLARLYNLEPLDSGDRLTSERARGILDASFSLSWDVLCDALGKNAETLVAGYVALGHGPRSGFGPSLGAAVAGLTQPSYEELCVVARSLCLLEPADRGRCRLHPLLADWLARQSEERPVIDRMTDWFLARLPEQPVEGHLRQDTAWREVQAESDALADWLARVPAERMPEIEKAASFYALRHGPFYLWRNFCQRGLEECQDDAARSNLLWTLGQVARRAGDLNLAESAAHEKVNVDSQREDEREVARAAGLLADILQDRGDFEEATRIREDELLPVYQRMGDERACAVTWGKIADILQARGKLEEATRIRQEEQLPVYERLGDERGLLVTRASLAQCLLERKQRGDRTKAAELLTKALKVAERLHLPEAQTIRWIQTEHRL